MSFRRDGKALHDKRRAWSAWLERHAVALARCGLPGSVLRDEQTWWYFIEHEYGGPPEAIFTTDELSDSQLWALDAFLATILPSGQPRTGVSASGPGRGRDVARFHVPTDAQRTICEHHEVEPDPPQPHQEVGVSARVLAGDFPLSGLREPADGAACGWRIWGDEPFSRAPDFFTPVAYREVSEHLCAIDLFLALPRGWRFHRAWNRADAWHDELLLARDRSQK